MCLVAGILSGFSCGLILTCGCSTGGLDVLGLYLSKKGTGFTVGRFSITFNTALYVLCAPLREDLFWRGQYSSGQVPRSANEVMKDWYLMTLRNDLKRLE